MDESQGAPTLNGKVVQGHSLNADRSGTAWRALGGETRRNIIERNQGDRMRFLMGLFMLIPMVPAVMGKDAKEEIEKYMRGDERVLAECWRQRDLPMMKMMLRVSPQMDENKRFNVISRSIEASCRLIKDQTGYMGRSDDKELLAIIVDDVLIHERDDGNISLTIAMIMDRFTRDTILSCSSSIRKFAAKCTADDELCFLLEMLLPERDRNQVLSRLDTIFYDGKFNYDAIRASCGDSASRQRFIEYCLSKHDISPNLRQQLRRAVLVADSRELRCALLKALQKDLETMATDRTQCNVGFYLSMVQEIRRYHGARTEEDYIVLRDTGKMKEVVEVCRREWGCE